MGATSAWVTSDLADAGEVGGKAASLAKLQRVGLPVPPAVAVTDRLLRFWLPLANLSHADARRHQNTIEVSRFPADFDLALTLALQPLAAERWCVRSSFALEDDPEALAAGLFESCVDVAYDGLRPAIRTVLASAFSRAALAYTQLRNRPALRGPFAILIHPFVAGQAAGHVALTEDKQPQTWVRTGALAAAALNELHRQAGAVTQQLGASELEWVYDGSSFTFLQWRPYRPAQARLWKPQEAALAEMDVQAFLQDWQWDIAHNPEPLSLAHQGLVALVENCRVGYEQKVLGGYLFYRADPAKPPAPLPVTQVEAAFQHLETTVEAGLAALEHEHSLEAALSMFLLHYEPLLGEVGHAIREGRKRLQVFLLNHAPQCLPLLPHLLRGVRSRATQRHDKWQAIQRAQSQEEAAASWAASIDSFGDEAPAWDLAAPTLREQGFTWRTSTRPPAHASTDDADAVCDSAAAEVKAALPAALQVEFEQTLRLARTCAGLGENDDALYARLQAPIRKALLKLGMRLAQSGDLSASEDVFHLSLACCRALASNARFPSQPLASLAAEAKALRQRQRLHPPPAPTQQRFSSGGVVRGYGTGGSAVGRVVVYTDGCGPADPDCILVARTLLPTQLPLIEAAALVTETGGPLDHVAAQARERNLPAIVGAAFALNELRAGDLVFVDADAGLVHRLQREEQAQDPSDVIDPT